MSHVVASRLAYAHAGGDLLFSDVSFRVSPGDHVGVVGSNGVGKSTLFRVLTGALRADQGEVSVGGIAGYMAQDVGGADDSRSVRELLCAELHASGIIPRRELTLIAVAVSHDRAFLRTMDRFLMVLHDGTVLSLPEYESAFEALADPGGATKVRLAKMLSSGRSRR